VSRQSGAGAGRRRRAEKSPHFRPPWFPGASGEHALLRWRDLRRGLGSYCWVRGGGGGCADAFATILGEETLEAPAGATLSFAYRGKAQDSLSVTAFRAGREGRGGGREDEFLPPSWRKGAEDLRVRRSGTRARIVADLLPGEYVLDVFARMPQGDASYEFRLILKPQDPAGP
jgi:hypothetical protein